jgi:hypothetical protein
MTLRRLIPLIAMGSLGLGCLAERSHERDPRLATEITRQERWAQDSVAGRATPEDLEKIRSGDQQTIGLGRKQMRRLVSSVDRGTWIREATVESLREDGDDPGLVADFEKAGQTRGEALQAADELAQALAETRDGLTLADLRKALESLRKARDSEAKLAKDLGAAAASSGAAAAKDGGSVAAKPAAAGKPAPVSPLAKLSTVALPVPRPFISAAGRYLYAHPGEKLSGFAADDAAEIRAQLADLELHPPPAMKTSPASEPRAENASPPAGAGPGEGGTAAQGPGTSAETGADRAAEPEPPRANAALTIAKDAQKLIARRGPPKSFATREGGLFALRYQETRSCGVDSCLSDVDYLFDASGALVREESTPRR